MASFSAGTTFTDGVANDVTAAKLGALVNNATPTSGLIQDRTAETVTATNDTLLIGDASDSNALKRITVANFAQTLPTAKVTTGTIDTGTFGTTTSTAATITALTAGTTTSTAATITTGTIPTLVATTLVTTGTGTAAAPAIVPTGDTNTGIFFPAADTIAFAESGVESMRIDSSGNVGIGTTSPINKLHLYNGTGSVGATQLELEGLYNGYGAGINFSSRTSSGGTLVSMAKITADAEAAFNTTPSTQDSRLVYSTTLDGTLTERLRIDSSGNVGIGTTSPAAGIDVSTGGTATTIAKFRSASYNSAGLEVIVGTNADMGIFTASANPLFLGTNNTERLRIDSSGNCSIGTATALSTLHVHGNVTLSNTTTATSAGTGGLSKPATYAGYLTVSINGTSRKIPYYAT